MPKEIITSRKKDNKQKNVLNKETKAEKFKLKNKGNRSAPY